VKLKRERLRYHVAERRQHRGVQDRVDDHVYAHKPQWQLHPRHYLSADREAGVAFGSSYGVTGERGVRVERGMGKFPGDWWPARIFVPRQCRPGRKFCSLLFIRLGLQNWWLRCHAGYR
jgi:hypothetical protein